MAKTEKKGTQIVIFGMEPQNFGGSPAQNNEASQQGGMTDLNGEFPEVSGADQATGRWSTQSRQVHHQLGDLASDWLGGRVSLMTREELNPRSKKKEGEEQPKKTLAGRAGAVVKGAVGYVVKKAMEEGTHAEAMQTGAEATGDMHGVVGALIAELIHKGIERRRAKKAQNSAQK